MTWKIWDLSAMAPEGAVYQAHAAGDALVRVDLGLAIGVSSDGVHSAGHGAGPLLNDNGLVGAHVGAAAAVDALAGVDVGAAVVTVQLDGVLGADLLAGWARQPWQPSVTSTRFSAQPLQANLMTLMSGGV